MRSPAPDGVGVNPPAAPADERRAAKSSLPARLRRKTAPPLPEVSELDGMRHFTRLSQKNYSIDAQFYPLGSCTMKYNPRINEKVAAMPGFARLHPMQEQADIQGSLRVYHDLQEILKDVLGLGRRDALPRGRSPG
jgi:glycine dehydrogenase subunit 2